MSNARRDALAKGTLVRGYEIVSVLGAGGFGITYLAEEKSLGNRPVAIKEYLPSQFAGREADDSVRPHSDDSKATFEWGLDRFIKEAVLLSSLRHPSIVDVFTAFEANSTAYMVMRLEEGQTLSSLVKSSGGMTEDLLKEILPPLLDGLEELHSKGIIHRDIKPDNIIIRSDGSPVLIDFGSARVAQSESTQHLTAVFTPGYSPPEQRNLSDSKQGPWTDIYGLGATIYFAISGQAPRDSTARNDSIQQSRADSLIPIHAYATEGYSERFLGAINWAIQYWPEDRPQSIDDWRSDLTPKAKTRSSQTIAPLAVQRSPGINAETEMSTRAEEKQDVTSGLRAEPVNALAIEDQSKKRSKWYFWLLVVLAIVTFSIYIFLKGPDHALAKLSHIAELVPPNVEKGTSTAIEPNAVHIEEAPTVVYGQLTLDISPVTSKVRLPGIAGPYSEGMFLPVGSYLVEVTAEGYKHWSETIEISEGINRRRIAMDPKVGRLIMDVNPGDAYVGIDPRRSYTPGIQLPEGTYEALVSAPHYESWSGEVFVRGGTTNRKKVSLKLKVGEHFRDQLRSGGDSPEMVVLATGSFRMGDTTGEDNRFEEARPVHDVTIKNPIAMGKNEVTRGDFRLFVEESGYDVGNDCRVKEGEKYRKSSDGNWLAPGFSQADTDPVVCISWYDAIAYTEWLSAQSGERYRLPSESEWEYAARASTNTRYSWGNELGQNNANCEDCGSRWSSKKPAPVGSFPENPWGLHDLHGNVAEWTGDCIEPDYSYAPRYGETVDSIENCPVRRERGGSWMTRSLWIHSAMRSRREATERSSELGFRVVRELVGTSSYLGRLNRLEELYGEWRVVRVEQIRGSIIDEGEAKARIDEAIVFAEDSLRIFDSFWEDVYYDFWNVVGPEEGVISSRRDKSTLDWDYMPERENVVKIEVQTYDSIVMSFEVLGYDRMLLHFLGWVYLIEKVR